MTAEEFLKKRYPAGLPISLQQWEDDMPEIMEAYAEQLAKEKHKEARHAAAEIALTVGISRSGEMAHQDIMNLKF